MTKFFRLLQSLFLFTILITTGSTHSAEIVSSAQQVEQLDVEIMNLPSGSTFDANAIKRRMKTKTGGLFSQTDFDSDLKTLIQDYDRVEPIVQLNENKISITLKLWTKPVIRSIYWDGNRKVATKTLQGQLEICPGAVFDRRAFNQAFHKLKTYYVKQGFFEAQLNYDIITDDCSNQIDILITVNEGRAGLIKKIEFVNFFPCEEAKLRELMVTKEYNFIYFWSEEGTYREDAIQHDEMIIVNYLQNGGFADARIKIDVTEAPGSCNRIILTITAFKGQRYALGKINFSGNCLFTDEQIRNCLLTREGKWYSPEKVRESAQGIINLYGKSGYIDADINFEEKPSCIPFVYDVDLAIEEGEQFRVGLIKVLGNCSTNTQVILHESLLIPGEVFNTAKLKKTEERLQNTGFFKAVNVYAVKSESPLLGDNYRDVHIEVSETSTGELSGFIGFSTNEDFFGGVKLTENNFNIKGFSSLRERGISALRGGGEYAHLTATFGTKSRSYIASWSKPYFMDTPWLFGVDLEQSINRYVSNSYDIVSSGATVRGMYPINAFVRAGYHYRIRNTSINVTTDEPPPNLLHQAHEGGILSAVGSTVTYDSTNHPVFPSQGIKSKAEAEFVGVGGSHTFFNLGYINSFYFTIPYNSPGVLKLRADMQFIVPVGGTRASTVPIEERLFLGADEMVRGFKPYRLGPKFSDGDPKGGMSLQFLSIEWGAPIYSRIGGFVFIDAGHLSSGLFSFGNFSTAAGYGFKVQLLPGTAPLIFGMGYPICHKNKGDVKRFFLTVGGKF